MRRQVLRQREASQPQPSGRAFDMADATAQLPDRYAGPWLTHREAAAYTRRPNVRAFYCWRDRHGIVSHKGLIHKADLDRVLGYRKAR